jgi:hypothetical protein
VLGLAVTDGYGLAATIVVACVLVVAVVLGYMIIRGETRIQRTRLGIFVERDKFDEPDAIDPVDPSEADTRVWRRRDED